MDRWCDHHTLGGGNVPPGNAVRSLVYHGIFMPRCEPWCWYTYPKNCPVLWTQHHGSHLGWIWYTFSIIGYDHKKYQMIRYFLRYWVAGGWCIFFFVYIWNDWTKSNGYPLVNSHRPWQIGVGRLVSIKNWWFSGSMFIYQRVISGKCARTVSLMRSNAWYAPTLRSFFSGTILDPPLIDAACFLAPEKCRIIHRLKTVVYWEIVDHSWSNDFEP